MGNRRGEIESAQLAKIILAVVSFLLIAGAVTLFWTGQSSESDACKLSVLTRATLPAIGNSYVPLKCTTQKICITEGKSESCDEFIGEKNVRVVVLPEDDRGKANTIMEENANAMYGCWNMMGQGKLDLFSGYEKSLGLSPDLGQSTCVICSRVALSPKVKVEVNGLNLNLSEYLQTHEAPGTGTTYSKVFNGVGAKSTQSFTKIDLSDPKIAQNKPEISTNLGTSEIAYIFMQIKVKDVSETLSNLGSGAGTVLAGSFLIAPTTTLRAAGAVASNWFSLFGAIIIAGAVVVDSAYNTINAQQVAAGYCGSFTSPVEGANGCSIVQGTPYDFRTVNKLCNNTQGNP